MPVRPRRAGAVLLGVLLAAVSALVSVAPAQAIYHGHDADFGKYRFMVSLRLASTPDNPRCGGTLIAPDIFLTAAHCVVGVPQSGIAAVVGANIPDWPTAPKIGPANRSDHPAGSRRAPRRGTRGDRRVRLHQHPGPTGLPDPPDRAAGDRPEGAQ
jgi:hypothetical protein